MNFPRLLGRHRLTLFVWALLATSFAAISLIGYQGSRQAIRHTLIDQELPLTSSNIHAELQKDLLRAVSISSAMAHDTFLRDWVLNGERNADDIARYLREIKEGHGALSSFFVSERTATHYTGDGVLKRIAATEPRDAWYFRARRMKENHEINIEPDLAHPEALTISITHRVFDSAGNHIGVTGIGLSVKAVHRLIDEYRRRYQRSIYFVDEQGKAIAFGSPPGQASDPRMAPGLGPLMVRILSEKHGSYRYEATGATHVLHVSHLPELKWLLFVEQNESNALAGIRQTLYTNLLISLAVTLIVGFLTHIVLKRSQAALDEMASTDTLTGLLNRHAFQILIVKLLAMHRREPSPISVLLADIDHFKAINDRHGHAVGDTALATVAGLLREALRESDIAVRWGGEQFLLLMKGCGLAEAQRIAEILRRRIAAAPVTADSLTIPVTVSIGVAEYTDTESPEKTIGRADTALHQAKREGRNRVVVVAKNEIDPSQASTPAPSL